jgi:hypothetical protein
MPIAEYIAQFGFSLIATYTDYVKPDEMFVVANALFAKRPSKAGHTARRQRADDVAASARGAEVRSGE